jgi:hypothetical protein
MRRAFLDRYDEPAAKDLQAAAGVFIQWLRSDWRGMYAELREKRPILPTPLFTLVTRATDVLDILAQPSLFSVKPTGCRWIRRSVPSCWRPTRRS